MKPIRSALTHQPDCLFCKINQGEESSVTVYEDDICKAFMDIFPLGEGHVLVIPKGHAERLEQLEQATQGHLFKIANYIIEAQREAGFGNDGTNLLVNDGKAANQTIPHAHIHLIPRKKGDLFTSAWRIALHISGFFGFKTRQSILEEQAAAIRCSLHITGKAA
jgi:histidine triad (HIT) family protein